ncbi:ATP-binding protein [Acinetobacter seifertii]|uniref:ATP-binding protein n=1 Tax=Acinetobacter seifertii TaxID=1530123 RepID=A0A7H2Q4W3_9GAMM|nr:ATP-binding protein [Acinetobacter seifertii]QNX50235.1 ATP-binding protein [Acinetobacter seifertii]
MLIQFSVENFRSIREEQTLSMVKNSSDEMPENYTDSNALKVPNLLKTAVIYGANASGKSSLIRALLHMRNIIEGSFSKKINEEIAVEPFLFDSAWKDEPTTFSADIVVNFNDKDEEANPVRVEYGFSATKFLVHEEWLSVYPNGREQAWFHRIYDEETDSYIWQKESSYFKGSKEIWKKNTRKDQLFLSTAVQLNSEQLKPVYDWFEDNLRVLDSDRIDDEFTKKVCQNEKARKLIVSFLQQADIDVEDIIIKKNKLTIDQLSDDLPEDFKRHILKSQHEVLNAYFVHLDELGNQVLINVEDESEGTQKLFEFAAPLFDVIFKGFTFIVDELNKSLHSDLVRFLVKIFNSSQNFNGAQLIITTHETSVLRKDLLRRDQIWFCEKNKSKVTSLYPLTDFSPHKDREDLEESYLAGRYGGKPIIKEFKLPKIFSSETSEE